MYKLIHISIHPLREIWSRAAKEGEAENWFCQQLILTSWKSRRPTWKQFRIELLLILKGNQKQTSLCHHKGSVEFNLMWLNEFIHHRLWSRFTHYQWVYPPRLHLCIFFLSVHTFNQAQVWLFIFWDLMLLSGGDSYIQ